MNQTQLLCGFLAAIITTGAMGQPQKGEAKPQTNAWAQAEQAFTNYFKAIEPDLHYAEVKSDLLQKRLPDFKLYVRTDGHLSGRSLIFVVNKAGNITDLGEGVWVGNNQAKCFRVAKIIEFVKSRTIEITTGEEAIEVVKLIEEIQGAPTYVSFLKLNTQNYTVFDKRFIQKFYGPASNWKYTVTPREKGWTVKVDYVGPPAQVLAPPTYEIDVDNQKTFEDLRRYSMFPLSLNDK